MSMSSKTNRDLEGVGVGDWLGEGVEGLVKVMRSDWVDSIMDLHRLAWVRLRVTGFMRMRLKPSSVQQVFMISSPVLPKVGVLVGGLAGGYWVISFGMKAAANCFCFRWMLAMFLLNSLEELLVLFEDWFSEFIRLNLSSSSKLTMYLSICSSDIKL